jgi:hypothetical protein
MRPVVSSNVTGVLPRCSFPSLVGSGKKGRWRSWRDGRRAGAEHGRRRPCAPGDRSRDGRRGWLSARSRVGLHGAIRIAEPLCASDLVAIVAPQSGVRAEVEGNREGVFRGDVLVAGRDGETRRLRSSGGSVPHAPTLVVEMLNRPQARPRSAPRTRGSPVRDSCGALRAPMGSSVVKKTASTRRFQPNRRPPARDSPSSSASDGDRQIAVVDEGRGAFARREGILHVVALGLLCQDTCAARAPRCSDAEGPVAGPWVAVSTGRVVHLVTNR